MYTNKLERQYRKDCKDAGIVTSKTVKELAEHHLEENRYYIHRQEILALCTAHDVDVGVGVAMLQTEKAWPLPLWVDKAGENLEVGAFLLAFNQVPAKDKAQFWA